jgi:predicted DNA-binding WGR domain protein
MRPPFGVRYFEKRNEATNEFKFWALRFVTPDAPNNVKSVSLKLWWGRIGTTGQSKVFNFPYAQACMADAEQRLTKKLAEGYTQCDDIDPSSPVFEVAQGATLRVPSMDRKLDAKIGGRVNADGWPIIGGRETRPDRAKWESEARRRAPEYARTPDKIESSPSVIRKRERQTVVVISTERVIDFED